MQRNRDAADFRACGDSLVVLPDAAGWALLNLGAAHVAARSRLALLALGVRSHFTVVAARAPGPGLGASRSVRWGQLLLWHH